MQRLRARGIELVVYEPTMDGEIFYGSRLIKDVEEFKKLSDVIIANRHSVDLNSVLSQIYTRDLFGSD